LNLKFVEETARADDQVAGEQIPDLGCVRNDCEVVKKAILGERRVNAFESHLGVVADDAELGNG
jgi:hypothetical protein